MEHALEPEDAAARVRAAADRIEARHETSSDDGLGGTMSKDTPFGALRAEWRVSAGEIVVTIAKRPAFLPEGAVRRMLTDGLGEALSS